MDKNRVHEEKVVTGKEAICRVWTAIKETVGGDYDVDDNVAHLSRIVPLTGTRE